MSIYLDDKGILKIVHWTLNRAQGTIGFKVREGLETL